MLAIPVPRPSHIRKLLIYRDLMSCQSRPFPARAVDFCSRWPNSYRPMAAVAQEMSRTDHETGGNLNGGRCDTAASAGFGRVIFPSQRPERAVPVDCGALWCPGRPGL